MPFRNTSFELDTLRIAAAALDAACAKCPNLTEKRRTIFAQRIIDLMTAGERDFDKLTQFALDTLLPVRRPSKPKRRPAAGGSGLVR